MPLYNCLPLNVDQICAYDHGLINKEKDFSSVKVTYQLLTCIWRQLLIGYKVFAHWPEAGSKPEVLDIKNLLTGMKQRGLKLRRTILYEADNHLLLRAKRKMN